MGIGGRVKCARKEAGLSLRALAEDVGVSAQAISKYERDLDMPSSGVLLRLAKALNVKVEYFFRKREVRLSPPTYRCTKMTKKQQDTVQYKIGEWLERYLEIESLAIAGEMATKLVLEELKQDVESLDEIEGVARDLREQWGLGVRPIENMVGLLEDKGIRVGLISGPDTFDACTFWMPDAPVIAVKQGVPGDRQRFSLGHELAHLVLRPSENLDEEKAAHRFAGAFLVPAEAVVRELGPHRQGLSLEELHSLKLKYGLSMQAWIYRAKDLGIISKHTASRLFQRFQNEGWHKEEPYSQLPPEETKRMERLVLRSVAEGIVSESRGAELLGKHVSISII